MHRDIPRISSVGRMVQKTIVPSRAVGIFWLGGCSLAFKSFKQQVYVIDPEFSDCKDQRPTGMIDIKPDLVLCTFQSLERVDLLTLNHIAGAFPSARFVGSKENRDWMTGSVPVTELDEGAISAERVHVLVDGMKLDVRRLGILDILRILALPSVESEARGFWNVLFYFGDLKILLVRGISRLGELEEIRNTIQGRIDVLIWSLNGDNLEIAGKMVGEIRPHYVIPIGYDRLANGRRMARWFWQLTRNTPGVKGYLFSEDYLEGMIYSKG